jgi:hypothetical protein
MAGDKNAAASVVALPQNNVVTQSSVRKLLLRLLEAERAGRLNGVLVVSFSEMDVETEGAGTTDLTPVEIYRAVHAAAEPLLFK